jgi:chromate transporter
MQSHHEHWPDDLGLWLLMGATVVAVINTKIHLLWLLALGALLGLMGWV